jgi:hypothetical protein
VKVDERLIQQLAERLKQAVRDTRHIETAQIQIVGLDAVKHRAGALWPELAARVRETSLDFIQQRIGPHDLIIPVGDGFLVVYAEVEGAARKCLDLQDEIDAFYLGQEATHGLSASVRHESLGAHVLIERLSKPPSRPALELAPPPTLADMPLTMLPVWSVAQQAITGYWITPDQPGLGFGRFAYDPAWTETGWRREDKDFVELDLRILERAVQAIQTSIESGKRCLVGYSVHSTTMMSRTGRRTFLQALAATPADIRPFLLGRVAEVQPGTPVAAIVEWVHQLRGVSPRMSIAIHQSQRDVTGMDALGVFSVACVLPTAHPTTADVVALTRTINVWSRDLKRQNLKLRLDNVDDTRLLSLALDGHMDFCTSQRLWQAVSAPEGMKPFSRDHFLKALPLAMAERHSA